MLMKMNLQKLLTPETVVLDLEATDKEGIIAELVDILVRAGRISAAAREEVLRSVMERERKMSTGIEHGVAIPHGKSDAVPELVAALGVKREGLDFDALDGQPSRIFILAVSPADRSGPHIQFLAEISRLLSEPGMQQKILDARSVEEIISLF